ncbi:Wzz/FepE/Etk N-terminal domain-containing protein [uncultured Draconibacterium sp.]|uniref:Wzz/FepE/Etk N-terminal domain-containing protein n=1 Tax=uncultured Draconibacterium sp. TaxID=1573823 RepID=UPI0032612F26
MTDELKNNTTVADDEIDLIALAKTLWNKRRFILITVGIFFCIGIAVALLTPKEYTASSTMVPQVSDGSSKLGNLSSLAAMAGFNLDVGKGTTELSPFVYPQIVQSVPFQLELMNTPFSFQGHKQPLSIYSYFTEYHKPGFLATVKKYTIGLPFAVLGALKSDPPSTNTAEVKDANAPIALSREQEEIRKMLSENVALETNDKEGYITLRVNSFDPRLAAQVAQKAQQLLQQYITTLKIEKASAQLEFIEERYTDNKQEFEAAQAALAEFRDRNKNVSSARARTQEERLQSDYQLAFNVYSELAQQLEQARIKVKEDTPVFSILKPVTVPLEDNGSGLMTLVIWTFMGAVVAIAWVFGKAFLGTIKEKWNEEQA